MTPQTAADAIRSLAAASKIARESALTAAEFAAFAQRVRDAQPTAAELLRSLEQAQKRLRF